MNDNACLQVGSVPDPTREFAGDEDSQDSRGLTFLRGDEAAQSAGFA